MERDIEIDDDFSSLYLYVDGKEVKPIETEGHVTIMTIDTYKSWIEDMKDTGAFSTVDPVLVPGFVGSIGIGAKLDDGSFTTDFDENDYIHQHYDGYPDVFINFPEGTGIFNIEGHDLNSVKIHLRDTKINKIIGE